MVTFSPRGMGLRRCLPLAALCCLMPAAMAAPPTTAPAASPDKAEAAKPPAHDLDGVMVMYTPTVVFFDSLTGKQDVGTAGARQAWVAFFQVPQQTLTAARHEIKAVTVNKAGTGATVLTVHHLTISAANADGAASVTNRDSTLRCSWTKAGGGKRIRQERLLGVDTFMDGTRTEHSHKHVPT